MGILGSKATPVKSGDGALPDLAKDEWALDTPGLWEYLTATRYEDGARRETATLTLFVEEGLIKGCLNDRDKGRVAFVSGRSVDAVLEALEQGLQLGALDWRAQRRMPRTK
jgi:hypothetical protein